MTSKQVNSSAKRKPPAAGKGRVKGSKNKVTVALKDAIMNAFNKVGGQDYLVAVALDDPRTFLALIGRVLPLTVAGDPDNPLKAVTTIEFKVVDPRN
jgi:hypothetical protein